MNFYEILNVITLNVYTLKNKTIYENGTMAH